MSNNTSKLKPRHIALSDDYMDAVQRLEGALRASSASEVVRRSLELLKFAHETSLTIIRVKEAKPFNRVGFIEIGDKTFYPKAQTGHKLTVQFSQAMNKTAQHLIDEGVAKDVTKVTRVAIGYMAQYLDAAEQGEKLFMPTNNNGFIPYLNLPFRSADQEARHLDAAHGVGGLSSRQQVMLGF